MQLVSFSVILGSFWRHLGDIIIIMIIRPRPAFGWLGLGGWSGEYSSPVKVTFLLQKAFISSEGAFVVMMVNYLSTNRRQSEMAEDVFCFLN